MQDITVKKCGECSGFCREYYLNLKNNNIYARQKSGTGRNPFYCWYTTTKDGEPNSALKVGLKIAILECGIIRKIILKSASPWHGNMEFEVKSYTGCETCQWQDECDHTHPECDCEND